MRPSQGFRKHAFISGKWKQKPHFEENGEPRQNGKKGTFMFWGTGEQVNRVNLFQGSRYPPRRASYIKHLTRQKGVCVRSWCDIQFYANKLTPISTFIPEFKPKKITLRWQIPLFIIISGPLHVRIQRGDRGSGPPPPLENYKNIRFLSNTGPDPLKITMLPILHSMLGHHRPAKRNTI